MKYQTMSPDGQYGASYEADNWLEAEALAVEYGGYVVLDYVEHADKKILVIEGDN